MTAEQEVRRETARRFAGRISAREASAWDQAEGGAGENLPPMRADEARLMQVLDNLLDNASRHTPEGGRISLSVVAGGDTLTLTVSDNGIGITADSLPAIFEPFVQDAHALGYNDLGLGIGLTVARALVRSHGGDIVAQSAGARRGSQFIVTLPRAANPDALEAAAAGGQAA